MKNKNNWIPTKFELQHGQWRASRNPQQLAIGSRLVADLTAMWYATHLVMYAKGQLLDLGCGNVPFFGMYQTYIVDNTCVDWGGSLHEATYLDIAHDLTKTLPFPDEKFDTILLSDVLEHIPEPIKLFHEMSRVLSKGGRIILNVPFFYCLHESPHDYYRYTEFALRRFAEEANLNIIQLDRSGGSIDVLVDIMSKHLQFIPFGGVFFATLLQKIATGFGRTKWGQRIRSITAKNFPLGYFMVLEK